MPYLKGENADNFDAKRWFEENKDLTKKAYESWRKERIENNVPLPGKNTAGDNTEKPK